MKSTRKILLPAALLTASLPFVNAQVPAMQKGISVELPVTHNAVPMPDADREDSSIVSVRSDGQLYCGIDPVNRAQLAEKIKVRLANQANRRLYIKVDARAAYDNVVNVLIALRAAGVDAPIFLTAQKDSSDLAVLVPPKGLEVLMAPSDRESPIVQLRDSGPRSPVLMVSGERVPWAALQTTLEQRFQNQREKEVQVKADGRLPFAHVVHAIDVCRAAGVKVVMVTPAL